VVTETLKKKKLARNLKNQERDLEKKVNLKKLNVLPNDVNIII